MAKTVFVTTELHPEFPGGAGVVVDGLTSLLGDDRETLVLLLTPNDVDALEERPGVRVELAQIPETGFLERSQAAANALAEVVEPGDRIEVQDFEGIGFWALSHRAALGLDLALFTVRFHGPYDLLAEAMETVPGDWDIPITMEREVFAMADLVLVPTPGFVPVLAHRYQVEPERIVVSPPPVPALSPTGLSPTDPPVFAVVGRLGEMKGSVEMVEATLSLLAKGVDLQVHFVGGDGWSPTTGTWMQERLEKMIPGRQRNSFRFTGHVERGELPVALSDVTAVVVPSRFESFNLAAHESRALGLPVLVPDIAAFSGSFREETGAMVYDGTIPALAEALRRLATDSALVDRLRRSPAPELADPIAAYRIDRLPRHPRSQAGLGTVAVKRLEEAERAAIRSGGVLQRAYRLLPARLARVLARVTPRGVKERLGKSASWAREASRREEERKRREDEAPRAVARKARLEAVESELARGKFPEVSHPRVTVVIPVFDDVRYLPETLASVYEQTYDSWEVVVVDDGSTDAEAIRYLDRLERPRLRLVRQENKGLPAARNAGISVATGEFVIPLDADDELAPEYLAKMLGALEASPRSAYAHCYARLFDEVDAIWLTRPFNPYWQLLGNGVVGCVLLRKRAWAEVGGYDPTMTRGNEDWELWLRLMAAGWDQVLVNEVLFRYRKHGVSMSVKTEAGFEQGRRMVRDRHPDLYEPSELEKAKAAWYPLVTAITDAASPPLPGDVESISNPADLTTSWGKFVVDLRGAPDLDPATVMRMARALEAQPEMARARTSGEPSLAMVRRWNLHDPDASATGELVVEDPQPGGPHRLPERVARDGWTLPEHLDPGWLPVQRQIPEETGILPDPRRW